MRSLSQMQIRQILKKFQLTSTQRKSVQQILQAKQVKSLPIRSYLYYQKSSENIMYMLIKGIVQIFYKYQNNQKLYFSQVGSYEFTNEEIILTESNRYNAIVKTSQIQFIQWTIQEIGCIFSNQLSLIENRENQRQNLIKSKLKLKQQTKAQQKKQNLMSKLSLPNLKLKNLTPIGQALEKHNPNYNRHIHHPIFSRKERIKADLQVNFATKQMIKFRTETLEQIHNPELHIQDQNQRILQKYRSRNIYKSLDQLSQEKGKQHHIKLSSQQKTKDKLFKEQLKQIIKRKLKYEQKHGKILKDFLYGEQQNTHQYRTKLHNNEVIDNYFNI